MSQYHRIASIVRFAARELFYHGTSIANLKSILSEGLAGSHRKVWETDTDERSRASFGGTYFTRNFTTATSSAGRANESFTGNYGDDKVIVVARLETRTPGISSPCSSRSWPVTREWSSRSRAGRWSSTAPTTA